METGTVKWFDGNRRFGFITRQNGQDVFVHHRHLKSCVACKRPLIDGLEAGVRVRFDVVKAFRGLEARNVEVIEEPAPGPPPPLIPQGVMQTASTLAWNGRMQDWDAQERREAQAKGYEIFVHSEETQ